MKHLDTTEYHKKKKNPYEKIKNYVFRAVLCNVYSK